MFAPHFSCTCLPHDDISQATRVVGDDEFRRWLSTTLQKEHEAIVARLQLDLRAHLNSTMAAVGGKLASPGATTQLASSGGAASEGLVPLSAVFGTSDIDHNPDQAARISPLPMLPPGSSSAPRSATPASVSTQETSVKTLEEPLSSPDDTSGSFVPKANEAGGPEATGEQDDRNVVEQQAPPPDAEIGRSGQGNAVPRSLTESLASLAKTNTMAALLVEQQKAKNLAMSGNWLQRMVISNRFESASAGLIAACTLTMAVEIQYSGLKAGYLLNVKYFDTPPEEIWVGADSNLETVDAIFNVLFLAELLLRILALGFKESVRNGWMWFDGFLVSSGWLDMLGLLSVGMDPMILRVVRLVRLLRLLKVLKSMRAFETLFLLVRSIQASFGALVYSFGLMLIMQVVMAILFCQLLAGYYSDESKDLKVRQDVFKYFGTFWHAVVTMFEVTLGNWVPVTRLLYSEVSEIQGLLLLSYRCCLMFAVLKVITAVFIAETVRASSSDEDVAYMKKQRQREAYCMKMKEIFTQLDKSGDGGLNREEFEPLVSDERMQILLQTLEIDTQDMHVLFEILADGDGIINVDEFLKGMSRVRGPAKSIDVLKLLSKISHVEERMLRNINRVIHDVEDTPMKRQESGSDTQSKDNTAKPNGG
eukprot:gnl/TRDRNA2_/TRDRNA2_152787_c0_seq1.p1 gnl/TRDRNA2_/TRDRNA2_152787_c0~~gnl/TRDRNA2_/TRDRNA2_152787_c0_seq1.p1  ORF type:complete len:656 (+),score=110.63 gnl/TRDRNA2_/TRDRNA2_152787_c0_seq1:22-1968(+)